MDRTAITRIEELTAAASANYVLGEQVDIPAIALSSGNKIESLEFLLERPIHMRARFSTDRLEDFCAYVKSEALTEGHTSLFIKPDGSGAEAVIDFGDHSTPGWGHHTAALKMKYTPEFAGLLRACESDLTQRALIDWLEDWQNAITPFSDEDNTISIGQAIQRIRRIDINAISKTTNQVGDFNASRTAMEEIDAKCGTDSPPAMFSLTCQVYPCTRSRDITARLMLKTGAAAPTFRLRIIGKDAIEKEVAEEIDLEIRERLNGTDVRIHTGSITKNA